MPAHSTGGLIVVLCKPPASPECKTRLAADVGRAAATEIYRQCLDMVLRSAVATGSAVRLAVAGQPGLLLPLARRRAPEADLVRQVGTSFAQRQRHEIDRGLRDGYDTVALLASDLAQPPDEPLRWALLTAVHGAIAIVPSPDGGYAILASSVPLPELATVPMSSGRTLDHLCDTLRRAGKPVRLGTRALPDVDTAQDLRQLRLQSTGGA
jgi:glycosyltransferase A (GT-A) superfamily protein (DUF2064 family)